MELTEILTNINNLVEKLDTLKLGLTHDRVEVLDKLAINYYRLTEHRDRAHKDWMSVYFNSKANSNAAKEKEEGARVPELYKLSRLMSSTKLVIDSLRTSISANKHG
jgi:hypothetical protein